MIERLNIDMALIALGCLCYLAVKTAEAVDRYNRWLRKLRKTRIYIPHHGIDIKV